MTMKQIYSESIQVNYSTITLADLIDVVSLSGVATRYVRVNYIVDFTILTLQIVRFHYNYEISESLSWMPTTSDISLTSVWLQSTLHIKLKPATGDGICKLFKIVSKLQKLCWILLLLVCKLLFNHVNIQDKYVEMYSTDQT